MIGPPNHSVWHYDYRAMHFSAKRGTGIEIACRPSAPSVRLSVCDVGESGSHKLKVLDSGVGGFAGSGGVRVRGSGGRKSPSGVQGQSPGGDLGAKPPEG